MNSKDNVKKKKRELDLLYGFVKLTGAIPSLLFMRPKVYHISDGTLIKRSKVKGGVLITSNHISFTDPWFLSCVFWYRKLHCIATSDLFNTKIKNFFFTKMNCIPIDKNNFSMSTFHTVTDRLKEKKAVVIFPEGRVNREEREMLSFKSGALLMAASSGVPILPVFIIKCEKWYQRHKILIGDSLDINAMYGYRPTMQNMREATELLQEKEMELLDYYNTNLIK